MGYSKIHEKAYRAKELISCYMRAAKFWRLSKRRHKEAEEWYIKEAERMLVKADIEHQKAITASNNSGEFLKLAGIATLKNIN